MNYSKIHFHVIKLALKNREIITTVVCFSFRLFSACLEFSVIVLDKATPYTSKKVSVDAMSTYSIHWVLDMCTCWTAQDWQVGSSCRYKHDSNEILYEKLHTSEENSQNNSN